MKRNSRATLVVFWIAALAIYSWHARSAAAGGFVFDDYREIVDNPSIKQSLVDAIKRQPFRAVQEITYRLDYVASGAEPRRFHLTNIVIHFAVALVIAVFWGAMLRRFGGASSDDGPPLGSMIGATFLFHPINIQAFSYISARSEMLAGLFIYAALAVIALPDKSKSEATARAVAATLLALVALFCKESAAAGCGAMTGLFYIVRANNNADRSIRELALRVWPVAPIALATLVWGIARMSHKVDLGPGAESPDRPGMFATLGKYIVLLAYPRGLSIDHGAIADSAAELFLLTFVAVVFVALFVRSVFILTVDNDRESRSMSFAVFLSAVFLMIPILPLGDAIAEHRAYMAAAAFSALPVLALSRIAKHFKSNNAKWIVTAPLVLFFALSVHSSSTWSSERSLWANAVKRNPSNARAWYGLGSILMENGEASFAKVALVRSLSLDPTLSKPESDLGLIAMDEGNDAEAIARFTSALQKNPADWRAMVNMAVLLEMKGEGAKALEYLARAASVNDKSASIWFNTGNVLGRMGRNAEAKDAFAKALTLDPDHPGAATNLALIYENEGDYAKALSLLDPVLMKQPNLAPTLFAAARISAEAGDIQTAIARIEKYLSIRDGNAPAWSLYAHFLEAAGRPTEADAARRKAESLSNP